MRYSDRRQFLIDFIRQRSPGISTQPGDIVTTLIEAQAELGAQADVAADAPGQWNWDALVGEDLTAVADMFGFARRPALAATGNVTLRFGGPLTRGYRLEEGTVFTSRPNNKRFVTSTTVSLLRGFTSVNVPVVAFVAGSDGNTPPGGIRDVAVEIEKLVEVNNFDPITGGRGAETDDELRTRLRENLFRSRLGSEAYYTDMCRRHPMVSAVQMVKPMQATKENLKIVGGEARAQEDSVSYTYEDSVSVFLPRTGTWLERGSDYVLTVDNRTPLPPLLTFLGNRWQEGDYVNVSYSYNSVKSRNEPAANAMHYLDLYVAGRRLTPYVDRSFWPQGNEVGKGVVTRETHRGVPLGAPYYVPTRQPVSAVASELVVNGVSYSEGEDYALYKDTGRNENSTRAQDAIVWLRALPPGRPYPVFNLDYYSDDVVRELQNAISDPEAHAATDDVLVHGASDLPLRFSFDVEWAGGVVDEAALLARLKGYLADVPMGGVLQVGPMVGELYRLPGVSFISLGPGAISADVQIRGASRWTHAVPLLDGSVPTVLSLEVRSVAANAVS